MSKHPTMRARKRPGRRALEVGAMLVLSGCRSQAGGLAEPAWPEQVPPEYPEPQASTAAGSSAPPAEHQRQLRATSSSPLASRYGDRLALRVLEGKATYYADSLAGNSTASGEPYRPQAFTAAHRSLPFGTVVRVIRGDNSAVTYVTINDRGPFAGKDRIIDLSRAAATELDMLRAGVVAVRVEVLMLPKN